MVFVSPSSRRSYADVYTFILNAYRRSPSTAASSIVILVAPDVDALCAARILQTLLRQDKVLHRMIPISGMEAFEQQRDELVEQKDLHTLILLNMGSILDLTTDQWFGDFDPKLTVHVLDSLRPQNLSSLFDDSEDGQRVIVWDDGTAEGMKNERTAFETLMAHPEDSDEDSDSDTERDQEMAEDEEGSVLVGDSDDEGSATSSGKRRRTGGDRPSPRGKRRRISEEHPQRLSRDERDMHSERLEKHYSMGTWHGQATSGVVYALAVMLDRVDNDILWLAILGLTYQYTSGRISRDKYDAFHGLFHDEVARLNPTAPSEQSQVLGADDSSIRPVEELRFTLYRHWGLYDAMYHSAYVANKLGIWKDKGRKRLHGLLAKMGFSITQTQQLYVHMDIKLKRQLLDKLDNFAPEYNLVELTYPSFTRCHGYRSHALSAADVVEGVAALLDIAEGHRVEIDVDGARSGGEWFGGRRLWSVKNAPKWKDDERENVPPGAAEQPGKQRGKDAATAGDDPAKRPVEYWVRNFWTAFDSLGDLQQITQSLDLAKALHQAIIRQGTSIIDKGDVKKMRGHNVVILTQGPDLALFSVPGVLCRLALWLVEAMRDRVAEDKSKPKKRKCVPFVVACHEEASHKYVVVGVTAALEFGDVRKNQFGLAFLNAKEKCNARTRHGSFDTSVIEINPDDLRVFLETLCDDMNSSLAF
ncbi:CDC45-like protein [Auriculariales sp. MPI-PUGE-AT-0066]|nr:CDC45-like protein [Auriculariales sp. MPI-PUGE-AT-0066]